VTHHKEWENYHRIRKQQIFDPIGIIYDHQHPTLTEPGHHHFILCKGVTVVTTAHIEFLNAEEAALRSLATDADLQSQGYGKQMMYLLEQWLKHKKIKILKMHARLSAEGFYRKLGYQECDFDDRCIQQHYINLGKIL
jgi:N-acetylglutamate synthase-like GNAT family acetyltransferase